MTAFTKDWHRARRAANGALSEISARYWEALPVADVEAALQLLGITVPADEAGLLCGRDGQTTYPLVFQGRTAKSVLSLSWHRLDATGKYEVVAYVS
jgi:hypothetical protein